MEYNDPVGGTASSIGPQIRTDYYERKALIEARKEQYFTQLSETTSLPKHYGKKIKKYHYLPLLSDANINDQGIDAAGATTTRSVTITIIDPALATTGNGYVNEYAVGDGVDAAAALAAAKLDANDIFKQLGVFDTDYATTKSALEGLTPAWVITEGTDVATGGNLYGSSKDVGYITSKMPTLDEEGGRVNRVGFTRIELEGNLERYGFFYDYTDESLMFDTDSEKKMHCTRELVNAAHENLEKLLQIDLLNSAGVVMYGGDATSKATITGENGATASLITYEDLMKLEIALDNNRCPKQTKVITGVRNIDTRVINGARFMYIGSELIPMFRRMTDLFGNQAFISIEHYASTAGDINGSPNTINGEIGAVGGFRLVQVPEMLHWAGSGASVTTNDGYRESGGNYDVFPALVIGDASFSTITFQMNGKASKFKIKHIKPHSDAAYDVYNNPYGTKGMSSLQHFYGFMLLRPERIALCMSVAEV